MPSSIPIFWTWIPRRLSWIWLKRITPESTSVFQRRFGLLTGSTFTVMSLRVSRRSENQCSLPFPLGPKWSWKPSSPTESTCRSLTGKEPNSVRSTDGNFPAVTWGMGMERIVLLLVWLFAESPCCQAWFYSLVPAREGFQYEAVQNALKTMRNWEEEIVNYHHCLWTNATVERRHNRIKTYQRRHYFTRNRRCYKAGI